MTAPGRYAAADGSFAKSAGGAAARGGILIAIAVVIGFLLLWQGFEGGETTADVGGGTATDDGAGGDGSGDAAVPPSDGDETTDPDDGTDPTEPDDGTDPGDGGDEGVVPTTAPTVPVDPPSEVKVAVLNGTGESGLASARAEALAAAGYVVITGNVAGFNAEESFVYYRDGYADEAKEVAEALSGPAGVVAAAPPDVESISTEPEALADVNVIVVLGADGSLS